MFVCEQDTEGSEVTSVADERTENLCEILRREGVSPNAVALGARAQPWKREIGRRHGWSVRAKTNQKDIQYVRVPYRPL